MAHKDHTQIEIIRKVCLMKEDDLRDYLKKIFKDKNFDVKEDNYKSTIHEV